jgi:LuxR family maltose regulon positive regulatory protein
MPWVCKSGIRAKSQPIIFRSYPLFICVYRITYHISHIQSANDGFQRLFVDEGPAMEILMSRALADFRKKPQAGHKRLLACVARLQSAMSGMPTFHAQRAMPEALSARELEVLGLIANGCSNAEIATKLFISLGTVKRHINNLFGKLEVRSRTQAVARAKNLGILQRSQMYPQM